MEWIQSGLRTSLDCFFFKGNHGKPPFVMGQLGKTHNLYGHVHGDMDGNGEVDIFWLAVTGTLI